MLLISFICLTTAALTSSAAVRPWWRNNVDKRVMEASNQYRQYLAPPPGMRRTGRQMGGNRDGAQYDNYGNRVRHYRQQPSVGYSRPQQQYHPGVDRFRALERSRRQPQPDIETGWGQQQRPRRLIQQRQQEERQQQQSAYRDSQPRIMRPVIQDQRPVSPVKKSVDRHLRPVQEDTESLYRVEEEEGVGNRRAEEEQLGSESFQPHYQPYQAPHNAYEPSYAPVEQKNIEAAVAAGAAAYHGENYADPQRLSFQIHGQKGPHSYRFGYDTGLGYNRQFRYEERDNAGVLHGRYGYYDQAGKLQIVNYTADPHTGFHAEGDHVPKPQY